MDLTKSEFDVATAVDAGAELHLLHPFTGDALFDDDKPVTITVRGLESESVRRVARMQAKKASKGIKSSDEVNGVEMLIAATCGWSGLHKGKDELEFNPENARWIYAEYDWIGQQVLAFAAERSNFFTE